ncbi:MAG: DUF2058 family protein [Wenzhouxiangellaceae bacterium]
MGSLQEQLLKAGLIDEQKLEQAQSKPTRNKTGHQSGHGKPPRARTGHGKPSHQRSGKAAHKDKAAGSAKAESVAGKKRPQSDLEAAYRARARAEKQEREERKAKLVAEQEQRRQRNVQLSELVEGKLLNDDAAEIPRYFNYMNKIRRILLTESQLGAVNSGELGIAVLRSRPVLLDKETLSAFREIAPDLVPDLGGDEPSGEDWDEQYKGFEVPDDLRW